MELRTIDYSTRDRVAYVTLDRPEKLNAMNARLHQELAHVWARFRDDAKLRVAILSGRGRCFSTGADLSGGRSSRRRAPSRLARVSPRRR